MTLTCVTQKKTTSVQNTQTVSKGMEKDILCKWKQTNKKAGVAILISDKTDFKTKAITRE